MDSQDPFQIQGGFFGTFSPQNRGRKSLKPVSLPLGAKFNTSQKRKAYIDSLQESNENGH